MKDVALVSGQDGGRATVPGLVLALHSPMLALLLEEGEELGLTLPLSSKDIRRCVRRMKSVVEEDEWEWEEEEGVMEAAALLGINWTKKEYKEEAVALLGIDWGNKVNKAEVAKDDGGEIKIETAENVQIRNVQDIMNLQEDKKLVLKVNETKVNKSKDKTAKAKAKAKAKATVKKESRENEFNELNANVKKENIDYEFIGTRFRCNGKWETKGKYSCKNCDYTTFNSRFRIRKHLLMDHNIPMQCKYRGCNVKFKELMSYKEHHNFHTNVICTLCGLRRKGEMALKRHMESKHHAQFPCPECGTLNSTKASLSFHVHRFHGENGKCKRCDLKITSSGEMKNHFDSVHKKEVQTTCEFCGGVFKQLEGHKKRTKCGVQGNPVREKVPCKQCKKSFSSIYKVKEHVDRIHNRVKNKFCTQCSFATFSSYNLRVHIAIHHLKTGMLKESCLLCEKETTNIKHHLKTYHRKV